MASPFSQTLRSLSSERRRLDLPIMLLIWLLLAAWLGWFLLAEVAVLEVSSLARLEITRAALPVEAPVSGRVVASYMTLDRELAENSLLVQLDTDSLNLTLREQEAAREAMLAELTELRVEQELETRILAEMQAASRLALDEAHARHHEAEITARLAAGDAERATELHATGQVPRVEMLRQRARAEQSRSLEEALRLAADRQGAESRVDETTHHAGLAKLAREIARLEGQAASTGVAVESIRYEISRRSIRTTVAGKLAEATAMTPGMMVREGDRLGTVLPEGDLKVIADFPPETALGRIRVGHPARLRLDGFPWTQYGSVTARVERVAGEPRYNRLRVELSIEREAGTSIPLEHGLTGTVEIEVENVAPAALALRAVGGLLDLQGIRE